MWLWLPLRRRRGTFCYRSSSVGEISQLSRSTEYLFCDSVHLFRIRCCHYRGQLTVHCARWWAKVIWSCETVQIIVPQANGRFHINWIKRLLVLRASRLWSAYHVSLFWSSSPKRMVDFISITSIWPLSLRAHRLRSFGCAPVSIIWPHAKGWFHNYWGRIFHNYYARMYLLTFVRCRGNFKNIKLNRSSVSAIIPSVPSWYRNYRG